MRDVDRFQPTPMAKMPRFADIATFMRLPHVTDPGEVDIALIGVPFDSGTTNRPGARHGPRQIREMSTLIRRVHHVSRIAPFRLCRCADLGDVPVNPLDLEPEAQLGSAGNRGLGAPRGLRHGAAVAAGELPRRLAGLVVEDEGGP